MSTLVYKAYEELLGERASFVAELNYSGKFSPYNANIKWYGSTIAVSLSREWQEVDDDIVVGLLQSLLSKVLRKKGYRKLEATKNMEYYQSFVKKLHLVAPRTHSDPALEESFVRLNGQFFSGVLELPNLKWGEYSRRKLGHYDFHTDTIVLSAILKEAPTELQDYVLYHEMLHKKLKYDCSKGRARHHTVEFKREEAKFPNAQRLERELGLLGRSVRPRRPRLGFWQWFG